MVRPGRPKMSPTKSIRKGPNPQALNKIDGTTQARGRSDWYLLYEAQKRRPGGRLMIIGNYYLCALLPPELCAELAATPLCELAREAPVALPPPYEAIVSAANTFPCDGI